MICFSPPQCLQNSLKDMKDVGLLQVKVLKAVDLLAADFSGIHHFQLFLHFYFCSFPILLSRSMYRASRLFQGHRRKKGADAKFFHFAFFSQNCLFQIILPWLDNVLAHLAFKDICGWFIPWLLYLLNDMFNEAFVVSF